MSDYSILYRTYEEFLEASANNRVVLFDVGYADTCYNDLFSEAKFDFAVTNNFWNWHKTVGGSLELLPPNALTGREVVLITNSKYAFEVERQLRGIGIPKDNIFCYMFFDKEFDKFLYINYDKKA